MYEEYIRKRITELRMKLDISEYKLSLDLGKNKGYIQSITSGRALPSMKQFIELCNYFDVTPIEFFDNRNKYPKTIREINEALVYLDEEDLNAVLRIVRKMRGMK